MENENYLTITEAAKKYNINEGSLRNLISRNRIPFLKKMVNVNFGRGRNKEKEVIALSEKHIQIYLLLSDYFNNGNLEIYKQVDIK